MAKIRYEDINFRKTTLEFLDKVIPIVEEYERNSYRLTVRQLYYQLVSRNILENKPESYTKTSKVLSDARLAGKIDWDTIVDRGRRKIMPNEFHSIPEFIHAAIRSYRKYRWENQPHYVEVWVEKEALAGILEDLTDEYHVLLLPAKGYSSMSAKHEAAVRIKNQTGMGKKCHILYLGDHDPSGLDMERDIMERLAKFGCTVKVERVALTLGQVKRYNIPHNPAKVKDSRFKQYKEKYGKKSWELDAIRPDVLVRLARKAIRKYCDEKLYSEMVAMENNEKVELVQLSSRL